MSAKSPNLTHLDGVHANHGVLVRERESLERFLCQLCDHLGDPCCQIDADQDREHAYFDINLADAMDDIDICVHGGHVLVRMVRHQ